MGEWEREREREIFAAARLAAGPKELCFSGFLSARCILIPPPVNLHFTCLPLTAQHTAEGLSPAGSQRRGWSVPYVRGEKERELRPFGGVSIFDPSCRTRQSRLFALRCQHHLRRHAHSTASFCFLESLATVSGGVFDHTVLCPELSPHRPSTSIVVGRLNDPRQEEPSARDLYLGEGRSGRCYSLRRERGGESEGVVVCIDYATCEQLGV